MKIKFLFVTPENNKPEILELASLDQEIASQIINLLEQNINLDIQKQNI